MWGSPELETQVHCPGHPSDSYSPGCEIIYALIFKFLSQRLNLIPAVFKMHSKNGVISSFRTPDVNFLIKAIYCYKK